MISNSLHILLKPLASTVQCSHSFHISAAAFEIQKLTRLRVVDNSAIGKQAMAEGKPPKCIHVYNKTGIGMIGWCYFCLWNDNW